MAIGRERYTDVLDLLSETGLPTTFTQTGGMCAALEVTLEAGYTLLITDADETLSWSRADHRGWRVGLYRPGSEYDDGPIAYDSVEDGSVSALLPLIESVMNEARR